MTVTVTASSSISYTGDGATTAFPTGFVFNTSDDIEVIERVIATGVETTKTLTTHYTVSGGGGTGTPATGTVTAVTAPASTVTWTIRRIVAAKQDVDLPVAGPIPSDSIEKQADRTVLMIQQHDETLGRALTFPKTDSSSLDPTLPSSVERSSKALTFDSLGNPTATALGSSNLPTSSFMATVLDDTGGLAALTTIVDDATALASRNLLRTIRHIDIREYSGAGDDSTDNTTPLDNAVSAAISNGVKVVSFPFTTTGGSGVSVYRFASKPADISTGLRIKGQAWLTTFLQQQYTPGSTDAFLEWDNSSGGGLEDITIRKTAGDGDGYAINITGNGSARHNWSVLRNIQISGDVGWNRCINVDGSLHTVSGSQGIRDLNMNNVFCFGGDVVLTNVVSCGINHLQMFQGSGAGLPTLSITGSGGGGLATSSSQVVLIGEFHIGGHVTLDNCNRVAMTGGVITGNVTVAATATNSYIVAAISGTITNSSASSIVFNTIDGKVYGAFRPQLPLGQHTATSDATAGNRTYTAAEILGGIIVRDCAGAGRSDVLPTAAALVAAITGAAVGDVIKCLIVNGSDNAETITIGAGSGGGFDTNQTAASRVIPQNTSKMLHIRLTNVTGSSEAYVAYL